MITSLWPKLFIGMALFSVPCAATLAQVAAPQTKGVYGGVINYVAAASNGAAATRVYVTADSADAVFYADVDFSKPNPFGTNLMFQAVPGLSSADDRNMANGLAIHQSSGRVFVSYPEGVLSGTTSSNSLVTNVSLSAVWGMVMEGARLAYVRNDNQVVKLGYGALSADGVFTDSGSPATVMAATIDAAYNVKIGVHPTNHIVYLAGLGRTNVVRSSDSIENLSASTVFTPLVLPSLTTNWTGDSSSAINDKITFGFGPDGRIFVSGYNPANTNLIHNRGWELIYSDDNGATWSTAITGGSGCRLWTAVGDAAHYLVYNGSALSTNNGTNWQIFATQVPGARVSSREVVADPAHPLVLYCATECGFGVCTNGGLTNDLHTILNTSRGIEAAVVNDFDLTVDKNIAWVAANGIRRAVNFQGTPEWSDPKYPMGDDSCMYVAVDKSDTNGLIAYAGCINLYKTVNGGAVESDPNNPTNWTRVFVPNNYGLNNVRIATIEAYENVVAVGLRGTAAGKKGALFLSSDGGSNWQQVVLHSNGVDVTKLLLTGENGTNALYATVANDYLTTTYGVFRINVADGQIAHELTDTVNMQDITVASNGAFYASGFNLLTNVVLYSKAAGSSVWTTVSLNGYPSTRMVSVYGDRPLVTMGLDSSSNEVPYMVGAESSGYAIYYLSTNGTNAAWTTSDALRYPSAKWIYVLFWDDLVVGTAAGLYGQMFQPQVAVAAAALAADFDGDAKSDPAVYNTNGNWKIKLSSGNYTLISLTGFLGGSGYTALAADFDGDGKADPTIYNADLELWAVKLSSINYLAPTVLTGFGGIGWQAIAGDFDGDRLADPALYNTNPSTGSGQVGTWQVKLSTAGYALITTDLLGRAGWTAVAADFDGDGKVDPAIYNAANGSWIVILSTTNYGTAVINPWFLGNTGYVGMGADFDGDAYADPAVAETSTGNWKIRLSSGNYSLLELPNFIGE